MRRLAERGTELAAEMRRRDVGDARKRPNFERLREGTIHRVASPQHTAVTILATEPSC